MLVSSAVSFLVSGAAVYVVPIVLSDYELDSLYALLPNELAGSAVNSEPVELRYYRQKEV